jgi:hypothetical protein
MLRLIEDVESLVEEDFKVEMPDPIRIIVPLELDKIIKDKAKELGQPYIRVLIRAAEKWLDKQNPTK